MNAKARETVESGQEERDGARTMREETFKKQLRSTGSDLEKPRPQREQESVHKGRTSVHRGSPPDQFGRVAMGQLDAGQVRVNMELHETKQAGQPTPSHSMADRRAARANLRLTPYKRERMGHDSAKESLLELMWLACKYTLLMTVRSTSNIREKHEGIKLTQAVAGI